MERNDSILGGALLLTAANLLLRLISIAFQVFLSVSIGAAGLGLMQLISTIGVFAMLAGTAGVRVTAMYLAAEEFGHRRLSGVRAAMRACLQYGILVSAVSGAALFFLSDFFAQAWLRDLRAAPSLFRRHGLSYAPDIEAATSTQLLPLVKNGLGIAFVPDVLLPAPGIERLHLREGLPERAVCLIRRTDRPRSVAAAALETMLLSLQNK